MATKITNGLDLLKTNLVQAVLHPVSGNHPTSPAEGQVWYRSDEGRFYIHTNGGSKGLAFSDDGASGVLETAFDANTILAANVDNTPAALTIPEQTLVGRITGGSIDALSVAEVLNLLGIEAGATADQSAAEILAALITVDGTGSGLDADTVDGIEGASLATQTYVDNAISTLVGGAPELLNTLDELAQAINDDEAFNTTITNLIATKTGKHNEDIGDGLNTTYTVNHGLNSEDVVVSVREVTGKNMVIADVAVVNANNITVSFDQPPSSGFYRVVVVG